jgi:hypothetical protein
MRARRGLLRLWIVGTVAWLFAATFYFPLNGAQALLTPIVTEAQYRADRGLDPLLETSELVPVGGGPSAFDTSRLVPLDDEDRASYLRYSYAAGQVHDRAREEVLIWSLVVISAPLLALVIGAALGWALRGFSPTNGQT